MLELLNRPDELDDAIAAALTQDRYAIDTEFHRERTYYPQVALIQLAWADDVVLIDPLAVDVAPLARLLDSNGLCVLHAAAQDLEVLELATGSTPRRLFDTQVGAGFLGISSGSLATLLHTFLGVSMTKGDRLTDWLRRPLSDDQLAYAAADVDNLLALTDAITERLDKLDRRSWADQESMRLLDRARTVRTPDDSLRKIKDARKLKGQAALVARSVAAWREERAAELDVPVRQVMPDIGVVAVAQRAPSRASELDELRGLDGRHTRPQVAKAVLAAVARGLEENPEPRERAPRAPELPKHLRPVVSLITSWVAQLARDRQLDPALIATRSDIEALITEPPSGRLTEGWRAELVGEPIRDLVTGRVALAFEDGNLVLEPRAT